jgi:toxin ParE1/3/4
VSESRYMIRPQADRDLENQAHYYATAATPELGHRFLLAAHETFSLLATQPSMGWHARLKLPALERMRVFRVKGFERILILYIPLPNGVEILRVVHGSRNLESFLQREGMD